MKLKLFFILALLLFITSIYAQDVFITPNAKVSFHSKTPIEDIDGTSNKVASVLNIKTKQVFFKIQNTTFQFKEKLMQEHFNENYMESDKFPTSDFNGKILDEIDLTKTGSYKVTIVGILNIHGKKKEYKVPGTILSNANGMTLTSVFKIKLADHGVEIPTIVFTKIAEQLDLEITANYKPFTKK
jgi:polyisoprenoid-binding protein YceI